MKRNTVVTVFYVLSIVVVGLAFGWAWALIPLALMAVAIGTSAR